MASFTHISSRVGTTALVLILALAGPCAVKDVSANETPRADALAAIRQVWPQEHINSAIRVAHLESGLSPDARGCAGECFGLFQISYIANRRLISSMGISRPEDLLDPVVNSIVAYRLFRQKGWRPWGLEP